MPTEPVAANEPSNDELFNKLAYRVETKLAEKAATFGETNKSEIEELRKEVALMKKSPPNYAVAKEKTKTFLGEWLKCVKTIQSTHTSPDQKGAAWNEMQDKWDQKTLQNQTTSTQGGFLVPPQFSDGILRMSNLNQVIFRPDGSAANVVDMWSDIMYYPVLDMSGTPTGQGDSAFAGGLVTQYAAEGTAPSTTVVSNWRQLKIQADKQIALVEMTNELLQNSPYNAEKIVTDVLQEELYSRFDWQTFNSNGENVQGILDSAGLVSVNRVTGGAVGLADLAHLLGHVHPRYAAGYIFCCQPKTYSSLLQITSSNTGGQLVMWPNNNTINDVPTMRAFGFPIMLTDNVPALGQPGDVCLINPSLGYTIGINRNVEIALSEHYAFNLDATAFRITFRAGGSVNYPYPIILKDGVSVVSPFIALGTQGSSFFMTKPDRKNGGKPDRDKHGKYVSEKDGDGNAVNPVQSQANFAKQPAEYGDPHRVSGLDGSHKA